MFLIPIFAVAPFVCVFVFESDFVKHLFVFFLVLKVRRVFSAEIVFYRKCVLMSLLNVAIGQAGDL